jgi:hypothetical protein
MIKNQINLNFIYGFLILIGIHSGGEILTPFLTGFIPISLEMSPYKRLIVVVAEIFLVFYILKRISFKNIYEKPSKQVIKVLLISITLYMVSQFEVFRTYHCFVGEDVEEFTRNREIANNLEIVIFAIAILIVTITNLKQYPKSNQ